MIAMVASRPFLKYIQGDFISVLYPTTKGAPPRKKTMPKKTETGFPKSTSLFRILIEKKEDKYFGTIQKNGVRLDLEHSEIRVLIREIGIYLRQMGEIKPQSKQKDK